MTTTQKLDELRSFDEFGLDIRILRSLTRMKFFIPTPVQLKCIPFILEGKDLLVRAETGSGKTAAYGIPIIQKLLRSASVNNTMGSSGIRSIVLVPTRELCQQISDVFTSLLHFTSGEIGILSLGQDVPMSVQVSQLASSPDIIICTPGRLSQHLSNSTIHVKDSLEILVIDEADLLLAYGYDEDIKVLISHIPPLCQSILMSATLSAEVNKLKSLVLKSPLCLKVESSVKNQSDLLASNLHQFSIKCTENDKFLITYALLKLGIVKGKTIFFVNSINTCFQLKLFLEQFSIISTVLNHELPQQSRSHIIDAFNRGAFDNLITTDEAGDPKLMNEADKQENQSSSTSSKRENERDFDEDEVDFRKQKDNQKKRGGKPQNAEFGVSRGIDFQGVETVINFDFPVTGKSYVHRAGRTARASHSGSCLSLITDKDMNRYQEVQNMISSGDAKGRPIEDFALRMEELDQFRYRVEDVKRSITKTTVKNARLADIKRELLGSAKLKAHFEDNPGDREALKVHSKNISSKIKPHLAHIPDYLLPTSLKRATSQAVVETRGGGAKKRSKFHGKSFAKSRGSDPLRSVLGNKIEKSRPPKTNWKKKSQQKKK
eukprot:c15806_g1_i1.p1 GENE.c15806_g1_i1~~c15806_g1_i1.p1  ORF type:complete len:604 (-),score=225.36 c15806_g1_i1:39-1850(-)